MLRLVKVRGYTNMNKIETGKGVIFIMSRAWKGC